MQKAYLSRRSFARFLWSYGAVMLLVLALLLPVLAGNTRTLVEQELSLYADLWANNIDKIDDEASSLLLALQYFGNETRTGALLTARNLQNADYAALSDAREGLSAMLVGYDALRDAGLAGAGGTIITRTHSFPARIGSLFDEQYFKAEDLASLQAALEAAPLCARVVSASYGAYDALLLAQPVFGDRMQKLGTAFCAFDLTELLDDSAPAIARAAGAVVVTGRSGAVLYDTRDGDMPESAERIEAEAARLGVTFSFIAPRGALLSRINPVLRTMGLNLLLCVLGGIALVFFFAYRNHLPLRRLAQTARALSPQSQAQNGGEYETVTDALTSLKQSVRQREDDLREQRRLLEQNLLEKALLGSLGSAANREAFTRILTDFPETYAVALLLLPPGPAEEALSFTLSKQLMVEHLLSEHFAHPLYHLNLTANLIALILPGGEGGTAAMERFAERFQRTYQMPVNIFLSETVSGVESLSEAYAQTKRIQRLAAAYEEARVWVIGNFPSQASVSQMDYSVFQRLYEAISAGDTEQALSCVDRMRVLLPDYSVGGAGTSATAFRKVLEFLLSILVRVKYEHFDVLLHVKLHAPDLNQPLSEYLTIVKGYARTLCDALSASRAEPAAFSGDIVAYIDKNISDPGLYQKAIVSHFGISEHALQAAMRERTGMSFAEYVETRRLDAAHRLLTQTETAVNEIAERVGFALYNTFYKAFKRRYGCPPSEYRATRAKG